MGTASCQPRNVFNPVSEPRRRPPTHPGNIVRVEKCVFEIVDLFVGQVYPVARAWISLLSEKHHDSRETRSDAPVGTIVIDARFAFVFFLLSFSFLFFFFFFIQKKEVGRSLIYTEAEYKLCIGEQERSSDGICWIVYSRLDYLKNWRMEFDIGIF